MKYRIAISGSYGGMNLGDEAILETILKEIQNSSLDVDVVRVVLKEPFKSDGAIDFHHRQHGDGDQKPH